MADLFNDNNTIINDRKSSITYNLGSELLNGLYENSKTDDDKLNVLCLAKILTSKDVITISHNNKYNLIHLLSHICAHFCLNKTVCINLDEVDKSTLLELKNKVKQISRFVNEENIKIYEAGVTDMNTIDINICTPDNMIESFLLTNIILDAHNNNSEITL